MQFFIALSLLIAIAVAIFAWQNPLVVTVHFMQWSFAGSLAFVCLAIFALGFLTNFFASIASIIRYRWLIYKLKKRVDMLEEKLADAEKRPIVDVPETKI
jgi:uncharacterized integral membrane protein